MPKYAQHLDSFFFFRICTHNQTWISLKVKAHGDVMLQNSYFDSVSCLTVDPGVGLPKCLLGTNMHATNFSVPL